MDLFLNGRIKNETRKVLLGHTGSFIRSVIRCQPVHLHTSEYKHETTTNTPAAENTEKYSNTAEGAARKDPSPTGSPLRGDGARLQKSWWPQ